MTYLTMTVDLASATIFNKLVSDLGIFFLSDVVTDTCLLLAVWFLLILKPRLR